MALVSAANDMQIVPIAIHTPVWADCGGDGSVMVRGATVGGAAGGGAIGAGGVAIPGMAGQAGPAAWGDACIT